MAEPSQSNQYEAPTSSPDPYATTITRHIPPNASDLPKTLPPYINPTTLRPPLPILGPLTGYTTAHLNWSINARFFYLRSVLHRPLSQTEEQAVAYHTSRGHAIASTGPTLGISAGVFRFWNTWSEMRWPFYGTLRSEIPGEGFWDGERMRIWGRREILSWMERGQKEKIIHLARGMAYCLVGVVAVPMLVGAYASTTTAVGELRDERMGAVARELRNGAERTKVGRIERRQRGGGGREDAGVKGGEGESGEVVSGEEDLERELLSGLGRDTGVLGDAQMSRQRPESMRSPAGNRGSTFEMERTERQPKTFGDDYDDASPTGGSGAMDASGEGSVWEQIRNEASSGSGSTPVMGEGRRPRSEIHREHREGSTAGDSFSFSREEEDRSYAKEEAQREFDERVEKERRGGDFGANGEGERW